MPEAVVIAEPQGQDSLGQGAVSSASSPRENWRFLAGLELLGESLTSRLFHDLDRAGIGELSLLVHGNLASFSFDLPKNVAAYLTPDVCSAALHKLLNARARGIDAVILGRAAAYIDFHPADALQFHLASREAVTRVWDGEQGPLDLWIVDPASFSEEDDLRSRLRDAKSSYRIRSYVNRLEGPQDIRRLVVDGLTGRCGFRPRGSETRPGVWIADGAEVKRGARVVAPAFIGRDVKIEDQCLITRCSSIESNSHIDYGTVVEDSSVLSGTYVGIGLDLSHSIADGVILQNLNHDVALEIADPVVMRSMRQNKNRGEGNREWLSNFRRAGVTSSASNKTP